MSPIRVVVADDSEPFRTAFCEVLKRSHDIDVVATAQDGVEALQQVQETDPDLLILDIHMPRMNGWDVLRHLQDKGFRAPVLILSAYADARFEQRALARGAAAYVAKGDIQRLIETIRRLTVE